MKEEGELRICKVCGLEKKLCSTEFEPAPNGYFTRVCRICRNKHKRIQQGYGTPEYRKRINIYLAQKREQNIVLYGSSLTPQQKSYHRDWGKNRRHELRILALNKLGTRCSCCGDEDISHLTIDHIDGIGAKEDRKLSCHTLYSRIITNGDNGNQYRVLCFNCNFSYGLFGYCPHIGGVRKVVTRETMWYRRIKNEMIDAYGGKCNICGTAYREFMSIDHIEGGGCLHRRELNMHSGSEFIKWLWKNGWPQNEYQLLCFNCNCSKAINRRSNHENPKL